MTCTQERFERDVAEHTMTIHRDDGVDRHITFKKPGTSCYWFEIVTWNGALCIRGDCGTYVFSRLTDMFEFFREKGKDPNKLYINPSYWLEKMISADSNGRRPSAVEELDVKAFKQRVHEEIDQYLGIDTGDCDYPAELIREIKQELRSQVWEEVYDYTTPNEAHRLIYNFSYRDPKGKTHFPFAETESVPQQYSFHAMWNLYAIAWAIRQYDAVRAVATVDDTPPDYHPV
jgi:hypothetical protein